MAATDEVLTGGARPIVLPQGLTWSVQVHNPDGTQLRVTLDGGRRRYARQVIVSNSLTRAMLAKEIREALKSMLAEHERGQARSELTDFISKLVAETA